MGIRLATTMQIKPQNYTNSWENMQIKRIQKGVWRNIRHILVGSTDKLVKGFMTFGL